MGEHTVSFRGTAALWITVFSCAFWGSEAALRTFFVEDLCNGWNDAFVDLRHYRSGILSSISSDPNFDECTIQLRPEHGASVVLSVYRFNLGPDDKLVIEDSQKFKVALVGEGDFPDERKSFTSDGAMILHYSRDGGNSSSTGSRLRFQFVFTETREGPCHPGEFTCRNKRCIPEKLACDRHNHCGDNSDQQDCGPWKNRDFVPRSDKVTVSTSAKAWIIMIVVSSTILAVIVIAFIVALIRNAGRRKRNAEAAATVTQQQDPTAHAPTQQPIDSRSVLHRIRDSFRRQRPVAGTEAPEGEGYQVPSMYPNIPSAPELSGVDNPEFRAEV